ncbi:putative Ig domain-containing protein [Pectobacterium odoriferum]|uniref:putative Ig domain-containing protein n=1 Tax=Pectobacterium odoriferum TaxID=78398 RepID=UPI0021560ABE|nr:putative Ig domain-containing protein [Pectobacterium odoriferum]
MITTSAGTAPTLSATGSNPVFIGGMAGSIDLFSGVSANTNDSGQTFSSLTLTVSNATDSGEFINVGGNNISLSANNSGTLTGIGSYSVTRSGNTVTLQLSGMSASNSEIAGLVDGLRYGNTSATATAATRAVTLSAVSDNGSSNNSTALNLTSTVNVLASNSALYVTAGDDTGDNATFGSSVQQDANDGGGLSLREALYWANNTAGIDRIVFQTDVTLASSLLSPTDSMLIDGQSFTLNGGGYSGFQIVTGSITLAIQNLTLTNFTTDYSTDTGGVFGISYSASDVNFRLYNVDISGNRDTMFGNGVFDLFNIAPGSYNFDFDRVNIHDNLMIGNLNEGVIRLFVSSTQQTVSLSITNSAITNNTGINPAGSTFGISGLWLTGNQGNPTSTHISLINTTITGQDNGIVFEFINNALSWVASVRNSIITGTSQDIVAYTPTGQPAGGSYTLYGGNNILSGSVNQVSSSDPRLAATASNAINQGNRFYVTGETDVRGLDRVRQGAVDIGAYESQFAAGTAPQVDLNGTTTGNNYSTTVPVASAAAGISVTDALATLSQTDGDSRLWTLTLNLAGTTDGSSESLSLSRQALLAAHAAGINVTGNGSQTLTLTGGATQEAFQIALRAIVYANVAATPTAGNRTVSVTANDDASSTATSTLTLTASNNASPVVSGTIAAQSIAQGDTLNVTLPAGTFTDPDGDTLTLSATLADGTPLPSWLSFNPATGTFTGTPDNGDVSSLTIKVTATDGSNASVSTTFGLTVTNVNDAPVVSGTVPPQSVAQDSGLNFTLPSGLFTDVDAGDTLTLSATLADGTPLPSWLSFNPATGTFTGTPDNGDVGSLTIKVTATDGSNASVSTTFGLTVTNVNDAPVVSGTVPPQSVAQDSGLNFTLPSGLFTDVDAGDTLTLSATLADGTALPAWLSFNPATGTFTGTPDNGDVGSLTIKVTATDGSNASVSTTFGLTVTNVNDAPEVSGTVPPQSVAQDSGLNFTLPSGLFTDADAGDTLTLSATLADGTALPAWLSFNPATGTFSGTPANGDVGSLTIKVTATDGSNASVSTTFGLTVTNVNDAPVVATPIPAQSVAQDGSLNVTVPAGTFTDPDGDTLTLSATLADGTALPSWLSFNPATGTFSGTPASGDIGNLTIKVTATDGSSASVSTTFSLTVTNVNEAPVVSGTIAAQSIAQGGNLNVTVPAGTFTDPDGDTLTLSATLADGTALPAWLSFNPATGTFSGTPANGDVGSLTIKVTATDGSNASVSTTFGLTVTNVNDAPVVSGTIAAQSIAQGGNLNVTVPAGTFTDPDGDTLTLSATLADGTALPAWLSFNPATGTFSGTPANGDVDSLTIKVTATDGSNASVSTTFGLTVTNVNDAPVVSGTIAAQSIAQGGNLNVTVPAGTFTDPDGDTLTLSATLADGTALPSWLSFNPATGTFSGTPANGDVGSLTIKVTATDGSNASVSTTFGLTVTNVNDAPVVATPIPPQNVAQGGGFNFTVPDGTFSDPDGDTLTLSATLANGSPLPSWLRFDPTIGTFSGTPGNADVGTLVIRVTATDGSNTSISTSFGLTVTNTNDAPVVATPIPPQSVAQGGGFNFTVPDGTFSDPDGDTLTLSATLANGSPLPSWLRFDPTIGTFSGTPGNADVGTLVIRVTATDGSNTSISTSFGLTVTSSFVSGDPQFKANDGLGRTPSVSDTRPLFTQDATIALPALDGLIANPSLGSFTVGNDGAPKSVMSAIFATGRQNTEGGPLPTSQVAGTFGRGAASGIGINFDSTLGSFPSFSKDPALGGTSSLASTFSGIYLPSLTPMEVFSGGSWKDIPLDGANNAMNNTDDGTGRSVAFTPSLHQQLQQIGDSKQQRLAAIEQALQESGQQQG